MKEMKLTPKNMIAAVRDDLMKMRATSAQPKLMEWQLRFYAFLMEQKDSVIMSYFSYKTEHRATLTQYQNLKGAAKHVGFDEEIPPLGGGK